MRLPAGLTTGAAPALTLATLQSVEPAGRTATLSPLAESRCPEITTEDTTPVIESADAMQPPKGPATDTHDSATG